MTALCSMVTHLLRAQIVDKLICLIDDLMLQQLLKHILDRDDPHWLVVVDAVLPGCAWLRITHCPVVHLLIARAVMTVSYYLA